MSEDVTTPVETMPSPAPEHGHHAPVHEIAPDHVAEHPPANGHHAEEQPHEEPAHAEAPHEAPHEVPEEEHAPVQHEEPAEEEHEEPEEEFAPELTEDVDAEEVEEEFEPEPEAVAVEEEPQQEPKHWYVVKVQSGREDTIKDAIERRVRKEGLEEFFGQIVIPVEKVTEVKVDKNGKRVPKTKERKLYPGYLMVEVAYNDRIVYLFRETSGVGDFVGAHPGDLMKPPTPMSDREVLRMLGPGSKQGGGEAAPTVAPPPKWLQPGDRVRVVDGTFNGMDGNVKQILEAVSKVQVELSIFGRPVAVDFEYYQVEQA